MKKRIIATILCLCMVMVLLPVTAFAITSDTSPTISGSTEMILTSGYSATSTTAYTVTGNPTPTVTQDKTYDGKIVWNNTTKKLDIAAGLPIGHYPVVLTAANGISPNATLTYTLTVGTSGALTTMFATNNNYAGNMFDIEVVGTNPVLITSFDMNLVLNGLNSTCTVSVYYREGGYAGHESTASDWTLIGTQAGIVPAGVDLPTPVAIGDVILRPGIRYGFYATVTDYQAMMMYTNMIAGTNYEDDNLRIISGIGKGTPDFTGLLFQGRVWNGTVYYTTAMSNDASLSDLIVTGAALNETFSPDTTAYTVTANNKTSITLGASKNDPNATMTLQAGSGTPAAWDGSDSIQNLDVGVNVFTITVTAKDGTTVKTYTVTVTRNDSPVLTGSAEMVLTEGYAATSTAAFTLAGFPAPTVTQDKTYNGKIVFNNTTRKIDITAGLAAGTYPVVLTASNGITPTFSMTFTVKVISGGSAVQILTGITAPTAITGLVNGTARTIDALKLPLQVAIITDAGSEVGSVTWNLTSCTYNSSVKTAQTFTASGVVTLPSNVINLKNIPLTVTISVTVNAADAPVVSSAASEVKNSSVPATVSGTSGASVPAMGSNGGSATLYIMGMVMLASAGVFIMFMMRRHDVNAQ